MSAKFTFGQISLYAQFLSVLQMSGLVSSAKRKLSIPRTTPSKQSFNTLLPGLFLLQDPYEEDPIVDPRFQRTILLGKWLKWFALMY